MIKILSSRGTGRSYQIVRYAISNNCNILVNSYRQINYMRTILKDILSTDGFIIIDESQSSTGYCCYFRRRYESDTKIVRIYTIHDALQRRGYAEGENIVIDDVDFALKQIFNAYNLKGITMEVGE